MVHLVEHGKIIQAAEPQGSGSFNSDWVDITGAHRVFIVCNIDQDEAGAGDSPVLTVQENGTGVADQEIQKDVRIWANEDVANQDDLEREDDDTDFSCSQTSARKLVVFEVDPALLSDGYDQLRVAVTNSHDDNPIGIVFYLLPASQKAGRDDA